LFLRVKTHVAWIQIEIFNALGIKGHVTTNATKSIFQLKYAKSDSILLLRKMYQNKNVPGLSRKRLKIEEMLRIIGQRL
jgi:hypothetical protein